MSESTAWADYIGHLRECGGCDPAPLCTAGRALKKAWKAEQERTRPPEQALTRYPGPPAGLMVTSPTPVLLYRGDPITAEEAGR